MGTVFGPLLGAFVLLGLEEIIKGYTDHSMVVLGPMILLIALAGKSGIIGLLQKLDHAAARPAPVPAKPTRATHARSEEHTSELQSLMRISYAVFCLKKKQT